MESATELTAIMKFAPLIFAALVFGANSHAQGTLVDQSNDQTNPFSLSRWTLQIGDPVGQEFVPTLAGLNFVEAVFIANEGNEAPNTLQVLIRDGGITGPVVGASSQLTFSASIAGSIHRFDFPSIVPLVPGQSYVMHFSQDGSQDYFIGADPAMAYTNGQMIRNGGPFAGYDLWFREGIVLIPEPSSLSLTLLGLGLLSRFFWKRRVAYGAK